MATTLSPRAIRRRYAGDANPPLGSFLALMSVYGASVTGATLFARSRGARLPERVDLRDLALMSVATFRIARLIAKDPVSSPFRAPFTHFEGQSGEAEVKEEVIGHGPQKAIGELVTCPFCLGQWVGTAMFFGYLFHPRATRYAASALTAISAADALQFGYDALQSS
ncbi:MAG: DUF1360 domain-containing protein [Frankiaceae bacterium]|nr:DUF1360 domain-containing protein [Frankiaceae bacterium]MBV9871146.1 DUF1360 domain-containing protein [Frankiaceae bacterium]